MISTFNKRCIWTTADATNAAVKYYYDRFPIIYYNTYESCCRVNTKIRCTIVTFDTS